VSKETLLREEASYYGEILALSQSHCADLPDMQARAGCGAYRTGIVENPKKHIFE
jgi:hypothetical protein